MYTEALNTYAVITKNRMFNNAGKLKVMAFNGLSSDRVVGPDPRPHCSRAEQDNSALGSVQWALSCGQSDKQL